MNTRPYVTDRVMELPISTRRRLGIGKRKFGAADVPTIESREVQVLTPMQIRISGIGEHRSILRIDLWEDIERHHVADIRNIDGVEEFSAKNRQIVIHHKVNATDSIKLAAQCVAIVAKHFDVGVDELDLASYDSYLFDKEDPRVTEKIRAFTLTVDLP